MNEKMDMRISGSSTMPGGEYEYVDLGEKRVIPGLIDCHMHPVILADCAKKISCLPPAVISIEELAEVIREAAKNKKKASGFRAGDMTKKNSKNTEPLIDGTWIKEQKISLWNCFDPALM